MAGDRADRLEETLLGAAVGDALGLPREGLSRRRAHRLFGSQVEHRLLLRRGLVSDDTEHAAMTGQALLASAADLGYFARSLAWRLRAWLFGLPAGIGLGALRAVVKLVIGFPPSASGVRSAGNGPAMRAPLIGACLHGDVDRLVRVVRASTRITHRDPRADDGAVAVAIAARHAARAGAGVAASEVLAEIRQHTREAAFLATLQRVDEALAADLTPDAFAASLGLSRGVSGYILHTVPVVLHAWLRRPADVREVVASVIHLGGDTDTTGAIAGALAGTAAGASAIPPDWVAGICDWPMSTRWLRTLAAALASAFPDGIPSRPTSPIPSHGRPSFREICSSCSWSSSMASGESSRRTDHLAERRPLASAVPVASTERRAHYCHHLARRPSSMALEPPSEPEEDGLIVALVVERYAVQRSRWPAQGRHLLAQFDQDTVVVYQAYRPSIARYAVEHGHFGGADFSFGRMSWIKTNFLWMMYRSGWARKEGQEHVLAVRLRRAGFDQILAAAVPSSYVPELYPTEAEWSGAVHSSEVRLQWDPDHDPGGGRLARRALQLGLRGSMLARYSSEWIAEVEDVTPLVTAQRTRAGFEDLETPRETEYPVDDPDVRGRLGL